MKHILVTCLLVSVFVCTFAAREEAQTAADKAIELRPDLADGYIARGYIRSLHLRDFRGADEDFRRALSIEPENSEALVNAIVSAVAGEKADDVTVVAIRSSPSS